MAGLVNEHRHPRQPSSLLVSQNWVMGPEPDGAAMPDHEERSLIRRFGVPMVAVVAAGALVTVAVQGWTSAPQRTVVHDGTLAAASTTTPGPATTVSTLNGSVVDGRFVRAVAVGGLEVAPDPSASASPLGLDLAAADRLASLTEGLTNPKLVGFGLVTLTGAGGTPPTGAPTLTRTPAWVAIATTSHLAYNCPAMSGPPPTASPGEHGAQKAAIFFGSVASAGRGAVLYQSAGTLPCGRTVGPSVSAADAAVPVAWRPAGPVGRTSWVSYQAPTCSRLDSVSAAGSGNSGIDTVTVNVTVPFDRTGCAGVETFTTTVAVYPRPPGPGSPPPPARVVLVPKPLPPVPPVLTSPLGQTASSWPPPSGARAALERSGGTTRLPTIACRRADAPPALPGAAPTLYVGRPWLRVLRGSGVAALTALAKPIRSLDGHRHQNTQLIRALLHVRSVCRALSLRAPRAPTAVLIGNAIDLSP